MLSQMKKFGWNQESLVGLAVSLLIGAPTFLVDIAVIYFCVHKLHMHYPHGVAAGFVVGALFNYAMNRIFVYSNSTQSHARAMILYFVIAFIWLWFTVGATVLLVQTFHIPLYVSRAMVGIFVGVFGFVVSTIFTFRIPTEK